MSFILGFNVDHIATLRNARGEGFPDIIQLANIAKTAGADQITAHLREDRRHIKDKDLEDLKSKVGLPLNMEMAVTDEMLDIAIKIKPYSVCLVPEKRQELTTEGGLNVLDNYNKIKNLIKSCKKHNIKVSAFIDPFEDALSACVDLQVDSIEINTGRYVNLVNPEEIEQELSRIFNITTKANQKNIKVHAGHGLNLANIKPIAAIKNIVEFNIGHFIISKALYVGLAQSIKDIKTAISKDRS